MASHAAKNYDDKGDMATTEAQALGEVSRVDSSDETEAVEVDTGYLSSGPLSKFYRGVLFQMLMFGALSFVGPAMSDAISNLGGGGLSSPYLSNLANSLNYAAGCVVTLVGGPLINKLGIKWSCLIAAVVFPLDGSSYYVSARSAGMGSSSSAYLLAAKIIGGFTSGFLYVAETTAMLSYPHQDDRGLYLGIWSAMRSSGSVIGGAVNFATNYSAASSGGIAWATYLILVGFECTGVVWALLLSATARVRRADGSRVPCAAGPGGSAVLTWRAEFGALAQHVRRRKIWLVFLPAFYSFFYGGTMGTYLSLHFSVRARALSTLIVPVVTIVMVMGYGRLLDVKRWTPPQRAWLAFGMWAVPQACCLVWIGVEYGKLGGSSASASSGAALDYGGQGAMRWAEAYVPYLIIFTTGYWTQLSLYWLLGTFSTDVRSSARTGGLFRAFETAGQAVSYAINSDYGADARTPFYVNCALLVLVVPCMVLLIRMVPAVPAEDDVDAVRVGGPRHSAGASGGGRDRGDKGAVQDGQAWGQAR